ncbi:hypothetical protein, partial [Bradyrhizobium sp.]|uniref:hypothetical protein n=1 Tax=Bradyrhizobium sp. TaxID=376 RepID=UPI0025BFBC8B
MRSIVKSNSGEEIRSLERAGALTRRFAPTSSNGRGKVEVAGAIPLINLLRRHAQRAVEAHHFAVQ